MIKYSLCYEFLAIKQVTRGHNIVADRWAGASNPHPHPNAHPDTHKHTQKVFNMTTLGLDHHGRTNRPPDQRTNGLTDGPTDQRTKPLIELLV